MCHSLGRDGTKVFISLQQVSYGVPGEMAKITPAMTKKNQEKKEKQGISWVLKTISYIFTEVLFLKCKVVEGEIKNFFVEFHCMTVLIRKHNQINVCISCNCRYIWWNVVRAYFQSHIFTFTIVYYCYYHYLLLFL